MPDKHFDVLIIGAGAAGLYAALCLPASFRVGLIAKDSLQTGASDWAQGGIAAAIAPTDSPELHYEDTMRAGGGLCVPEAVRFLVENAPACVESLLALGVTFDRREGQLAATLEAAHSRPRVLHAADTTGRAIVTTLIEQVLARPNIEILVPAFALSLWRDRDTGRCIGASVLHENRLCWLRGDRVVLATGGGGQVFSQSTNPPVSTGDGVAIAWRAGAKLRDLEFFQFHPTALTVPGAPRFLISEAVRGEGAHLLDARGDRFASNYHPQGELAPRDVVSRAIYMHLQQHRGDRCVYLDVTPIDRDRLRYRFPNIIRVCQHWGIDVFREPIPVAPAAHYWMGGVAVNLQARTSIPGLYAIGEVASTGVHGANRLASNSLLECLVFGAQLAQLELEVRDRSVSNSLAETIANTWDSEREYLATIRQELPVLVWDAAGICRTQSELDRAIARVREWRSQLANGELWRALFATPPGRDWELPSLEMRSQLTAAAETFNLLDVAYLVLKSAAWRTESRGGHYRTDYPAPDPSWQVHTLVEGDRAVRSSQFAVRS